MSEILGKVGYEDVSNYRRKMQGAGRNGESFDVGLKPKTVQFLLNSSTELDTLFMIHT